VPNLSRPSEEANSSSPSQVISHILEELNIHYIAHYNPPFLSFLSQINFNIMTHLNTAISGFRRELAENCDLLAYYAASSGHFLPTFRDK
jgi:hypothetical protein